MIRLIRLIRLLHKMCEFIKSNFPFNNCEAKHQGMQILSSLIGAERQDICCIFKLQTASILFSSRCWKLNCENTIYHKMSDEFAFILLSLCDPKTITARAASLILQMLNWICFLKYLHLSKRSWKVNILHKIIYVIVFIILIYLIYILFLKQVSYAYYEIL